jgi:hypothetical protein
VLKVEYAHLGELQRIERLNDKFIQLQPISLRQIGRIDQVPLRRTDGALVTDNKTTPTRGPGTDAPSSTDAPSASATLRSAAKPEAGARAPASGPNRPAAAAALRAPVVDDEVTAAPVEEADGAAGAPPASKAPSPSPPRVDRGVKGGGR